jgi:flagellar basal-body rod modification protein FlgD
MLVAQLKNQDPTNPMDNAALTTQMAQISTVQGVQQLNTTLSQFVSSNGNATKAINSAGLIGQEVLAPSSTVTVGSGASGSVQSGVYLPSAADSVTVNLVDSNGNVVSTQKFGASPAGTLNFNWSGTSASGAALPAGTYHMQVSALSGSTPVNAQTLALSQVVGVTDGASSTMVSLAGGNTVSSTDVHGVFHP